MAETTSPEPPTYYANIVTASVDPDVVYLEFRRYITSHLEMYRRARTSSATPAPSLTEEAAYELEPVARVILTFTGAKALQTNLNELIPKMEHARKIDSGR